MRLAKLVLGLAVLGLLCLTVAHAEVSADAAPVRKIVAFAPETPAAERLAIAATAGGQVVRTLELIDAVVIELPSSGVRAAEARLKSRKEVVRIDDSPRIKWIESTLGEFALPAPGQVIKRFTPSRGKDAPPANPPAGQEVPWGIARVNAAGAWSVTRGEGVKVAVIDTGIDYNHPELKAVVKGGWNATSKEKPEDFMDDNSHGSHVSGTIAAADNGEGVVGVAPKVDLYGVKVLDAGGSGTFDDVIAGMQWAVQNRMHIANMSLGASRGNDSLKAAMVAMHKAGVAVIAAAGNSGGAVGFPAAYPEAIAVAASDSADKTAYFSSRGPEVALIAPGVDVKSTTPGAAYDSYSGTSMATPHVAGLAALLISAKGTSGVEAVRAALKAAATPLKDIPVTEQGAGMIDAAKLVK